MKKLSLLFLFPSWARATLLLLCVLLVLPTVLAYNCNQLSVNLQDECQVLNNESEDLIANLVYTSNTQPNHTFISSYNQKIVLYPPTNTTLYSSGTIKNAWIEILTIQPSVKYNNTLFVPERITLRAETNYQIQTPNNYYNNNKQDGEICELRYSATTNNQNLFWSGDGNYLGNTKILTTSTTANDIAVETTITSTTKVRLYEWDKYCSYRTNTRCKRYKYDCDYKYTYSYTDKLTIRDNQEIQQYANPSDSTFMFLHEYGGTHQGEISTHPQTNTQLTTNNSQYTQNTLRFEAEFTHKQYYLLQLIAIDENTSSSRNIIKENNTFYLPENISCQVTTTSFFQTTTNNCQENYSELSLPPFKKEKSNIDISLLWKGGLFILTILLIFKGIKKTWGKALLPLGMLLLMPTMVKAETCGLSNLATCIPEKIFDFFLQLINAPLVPLLNTTKNLLTNPVSIDLFQGIWSIIIYILSMFFGLLIIYSGFQFLFSGHNVIRREMAKQWLKNTIIMMVLIQGSFYIYKLIIELGSVMSSSVMSLVDPNFFLLTASSLSNIGLEFLFATLYAITLLATILLLGIRYMVVAFGVIFAPIGIFCYFIPPLKSYGRLIINSLLMNIFMTFIVSIIILASSMLTNLSVFGNMKILVMINCFSIINIVFIMLTIKTIKKSIVGDGAEKMAEAAKYIAMMV